MAFCAERFVTCSIKHTTGLFKSVTPLPEDVPFGYDTAWFAPGLLCEHHPSMAIFGFGHAQRRSLQRLQLLCLTPFWGLQPMPSLEKVDNMQHGHLAWRRVAQLACRGLPERWF